mmetsp:Transcript_94945/g.245196  ORF Transcript_94945/g.245196 Transcript_94945/m.245196 type:complete len:252 (-) Transcript_94945:551-1306(-)
MVTARNLRIQLHAHAILDVVLRQVHALHHADAGTRDGLVLLVAHGAQEVNAPNPHPIEHIRHHRLEARVADAGNGLRVVEVHLRPVATLLVDAGVVDAELDDLAEAAPLLAEVDHHTDAATLRALDRLPKGEDEIRPAAADVAAEHIGADALIMHAHHDLGLGVAELPRVAKGVDGAATHRRDVGAHLRIQQPVVVRELVQRRAELVLAEIEALSQRGNIPGVVHCALGGDDAILRDDRAVHLQVLQLRDV